MTDSHRPTRDPYEPDPSRLDPYAPKSRDPLPEVTADDGSYDLLDDDTAGDLPIAGLADAPVLVPRPGGVSSTGVRCVQCGYNLTGVVIGGTCPECGMSVDPSVLVGGRPASGYAITAMVLGIVSTTASTAGCFCLGPVIGLPCGVVGLVFWQMARAGIREGNYSPGSSGMNTAGLVTSIIGLAMGALFAAFLAWSFLAN